MKPIASILFVPATLIALTLFVGCAKKCGCSAAKFHPTVHAAVDVKPLGETGVTGQLTLENVKDGVRIHGQITGLPPNSKHGFHVHEKGDCSAPDGSSAGGHFKVGEEAHGGLGMHPSHRGDLGNIEADANGIAIVDLIKEGATLEAGEASLAGRSVIVHKDADDLHTQPTGGSGPRIACGVIQVTGVSR